MSSSTAPVVWVLVHDASRTGVPVVLDRMLTWLERTHGVRPHLVLDRGGPLLESLARHASSLTVLRGSGRRAPLDAVAATADTVGADHFARRVRGADRKVRLRGLPSPDVVVVHGIGGAQLLDVVPDGVPVVVHIHELRAALDRSLAPAARRELFARARAVMAVSTEAADRVVGEGADPGAVSVVPGVVADEAPHDHESARARLGSDLGIHGAVIGGASSPSWRKGTDRLPTILGAVRGRRADTSLVWVGGRPDGAASSWVGAAPGEGLHWLEETPDVWRRLAGVDVVVIPSREDPLPLVALEAGQHRRPVVACASGGLVDLLGDGRGAVVEQGDLRGFASAVTLLLDDPEQAGAFGEALAARVAARHRTAVVGPQWWTLIVEAAR